MIANARMYSVTPHVAALWRRLLGVVLAGAGSAIEIVGVIKSTEPTAVPLLTASGPASPGITAAFLSAGDAPATAALMDQLLVRRFVRPEGKAYDELRERLLTMRAFWRWHPLAERAHPLFIDQSDT